MGCLSLFKEEQMDLNKILYDAGQDFLRGQHRVYAHIDHIGIDRVLTSGGENIAFSSLIVEFDLDKKVIRLKNGGPFTSQKAIKSHVMARGTAQVSNFYFSSLIKLKKDARGRSKPDKDRIIKLFTEEWPGFFARIDENRERFPFLQSQIEKLKDNELIQKGIINLETLESNIIDIPEEADIREIAALICNDYYVLIIPEIREKKKVIKITEGEEYRDYCDFYINGEPSTKTTICPVCRQNSPIPKQKNKSYTPERYMLTKLFTTTKTNMAFNFKEKNYQKSFAPCWHCRPYLYAGSKKLFLEQIHLAGYRTIIAPEIIIPGSTQADTDLKEIINTFFHGGQTSVEQRNSDEFFQQISDKIKDYADSYAINLISYETDWKSIDIYNIIEDIPPLTFSQIATALDQANKPFRMPLYLGDIYHMIPLIKTKTAINSKPVFEIYNSIYQGYKIDTYQLLRYYSQALTINAGQIKRRERNPAYPNLSPWYYYNNERYREDPIRWFYKRLTNQYLMLLLTLQNLGLLTTNLLNPREEININLNAANISDDKKRNDSEDFLNCLGYSKEAQAMFYLGRLIAKTEYVQRAKAKETSLNRAQSVKTITSMIPFNAFDYYHILLLHKMAVEKLEKHNKLGSNKYIIKQFARYFGSHTQETWDLPKEEALLYFMSGYSYYFAANNTVSATEDAEGIKDINNFEEDENGQEN